MPADPGWREYEKAVSAFVQALDPGATVIHDARQPDPDTGRQRQRDVWIETRLFGHFPVTVLVSCKRYKRKVNALDVEHFSGELQNAKAHLGVLYSYSGFAPEAIEKGKAINISCCSLYTDAPSDLPDVLALDSYCFTSRVHLSHLARPAARGADLLPLLAREDAAGRTVMDVFESAFRAIEQQAIVEVRSRLAAPPRPRTTDVVVDARGGTVRLRMSVSWRAWRGRVEAHLLNGSYCHNDDNFLGSQTTPAVDLKGPHPGPGWVEVQEIEYDPRRSSVRVLLYGANVRQSLVDGLGDWSNPGTQSLITDVLPSTNGLRGVMGYATVWR